MVLGIDAFVGGEFSVFSFSTLTAMYFFPLKVIVSLVLVLLLVALATILAAVLAAAAAVTVGDFLVLLGGWSVTLLVSNSSFLLRACDF